MVAENFSPFSTLHRILKKWEGTKSMVLANTKKAIESLYLGVCTVYIREKYLDPLTKQTNFTETAIITDQPCRLSYSRISPNTETDRVSQQHQVIKLFIDSSLDIPAGCKIIVTQNNTTQAYKSSGVPAVYRYHQEIELEIFERWA